MREHLLKFFHREFTSIHQAAILLALAGVGADILGLLRDRFLASTFGAGKTLDIYYAAFRLPDFIYTILLFLTASTAFIPIFLEKFSRDEKEAKEFLGNVLFFSSTVITVFLIAAFFLAPYLTFFVAPGFTEADRGSLVALTRVLLLSPLLLGLSNIISGVIQSFRRFFVYALSPLLYNVGIIVGVLVFYPLWGFLGVAWGVALGALLHLLIQIPSLLKLNFRPLFKFSFSDMRQLVKFSLPRTLGLGFNQLVLFFITALASTFGKGSIAVFNFAMNLQSIPLSIIGLSYSVAAFPTLSRFYLNNDRSGFIDNVSSAARHIVFWSLPAAVLFIVLRAQIVRVILGAGVFGWLDTRLTAASLLLFSFSVLSQGIVMLYVRAFYAAGKILAPLLFNAASSAAIIIFSLLFLRWLETSEAFRYLFTTILRVGDIASTQILILPFAFSLGSILNALILWFWFRRNFGDTDRIFLKSFLQVFSTSVVMGFVSYFGLQLFALIFNLKTFPGILFQGFFAGILGLVLGIGILRFLKNKELEEITIALKRRFWKAEVLASEPEKLP